MALLDFRRDPRIVPDHRDKLREFCQELGGDPVVLANSLGLKVYRKDLPLDQDGYIEVDRSGKASSGYRIVLNQNISLERQKFTLAHEIGHFVLHVNSTAFREKQSDDSNVIAFPSAFRLPMGALEFEERPVFMEFEADQFAVNLLLPANAVRKSTEYIEGRPIALSRRLGLSNTFVLKRFEELRFD